jgi:hypothetical protein
MRIKIESDGLISKITDMETGEPIENITEAQITLTPRGAYAELVFRIHHLPINIVAQLTKVREDLDANQAKVSAEKRVSSHQK